MPSQASRESVLAAESQSPLDSLILGDKSVECALGIYELALKDRDCMHKRNAEGLYPIHFAIRARNYCAVNYALCELSSLEELNSRDNIEQMTPLELLRRNMRENRAAALKSGCTWPGYSDEELRADFLLKLRLGQILSDETAEYYIERRRLGCTCDLCEQGWLSLRMLMRLSLVCEKAMAWLDDLQKSPLIVPRVPIKISLLEECPAMQYIPRAIWPDVYKSFVPGYRYIFYVISEILRSEAPIPTDARIKSGLLDAHFWMQSNLDMYFRKGGRISYALSCILDQTKKDVTAHGVLDEPLQKKLLSLPECYNDSAFALVHQRLELHKDSGVWMPTFFRF